MTPNYSEALCEVSYIINNLDKSDYNKIPKKIIEFVEKNKSKYYEIKFDIEMPYEGLNLKKETLAILGVIYRKFLSPLEKREELNKRYYERLKEEKQNVINRVKYNSIPFNSSNNYEKIIEETENNLILTIDGCNEKWYKKIYSKIKNFISFNLGGKKYE